MKLTNFSKILATSAFVLVAFSPVHASAAGTTSLSLSGSTATVGSSLPVSIYESGNDLTTITVRLSYDATKLSCTSASVVNGNVFPASISTNCGNGSATITRSINGGDPTVSSPPSRYVVGINFTTIAAGNATVSIIAGSQVPKNGVDDWDGVTSSSSYAITTPVATQPTAPPSTSTTGSTNNTSSTNKTSAAATSGTPSPAEVSTAQVKAASTTDAVVVSNSSKTDAPSTLTKAKDAKHKSAAPWVWTNIIALLLAASAVAYAKHFRKPTVVAKKPVRRTIKAKKTTKTKKS